MVNVYYVIKKVHSIQNTYIILYTLKHLLKRTMGTRMGAHFIVLGLDHIMLVF